LLGVYSDQSGSPGSLLGVTPSTAINSTAGWQTVSLMSPAAVNTGQTVWLTWVFENNPGVRFTSGIPGRAGSSDIWSGGMPADFGLSTIANYKYSIYCNYFASETGLKKATTAEITQNDSSISAGNNNETAMNLSVEYSVHPLEITDFKIYPNPANSFINVDYSVVPETETRIVILDGSGRIIVNRLVDASSNRIDISQLSPGLYFVKSMNQQWSSTKKLMVAH
jgi:hypothetical protein